MSSPLSQSEFTANGKKFVISDKLSIRRWKEYEKLGPRLTYGVDFESMNKQHTKAWEALNKQKFADASVIIHNLMNGIKDVNDDKRVHPCLLMCALLINYEGENAAEYDEKLQHEKIKDWEAEGLSIADFFHFALNAIQGFRETYISYIQKQAEKVSQNME